MTLKQGKKVDLLDFITEPYSFRIVRPSWGIAGDSWDSLLTL